MSALPQPFSGSTIHGGSPALRVLQSVSFGTTQRRQYSLGAADDGGTRADARRSHGWDRPKKCDLSQVRAQSEVEKRKPAAAPIVGVFIGLSGKSGAACDPSATYQTDDSFRPFPHRAVLGAAFAKYEQVSGCRVLEAYH